MSCTTLLVVHFLWGINYVNGVSQYILTLCGLSCIFTPAPQTIWYISMLILFYLLTPAINSFKKVLPKSFFCLALFAVFLLLKLFVIDIDNRLLLMFPMYCIGLIIAPIVKLTDNLSLLRLFVSSGAFLLLVFIKININFYVIDYFIIGAFTMLCLEIGKLCAKSKILFCILNFISYGSMVAYLFHRQFFGAVFKITGDFPIWFAYLIALPALIAISYFVQYLYDRLFIKRMP